MRSKLYHLGLIASSTFTMLTLATVPVYAHKTVENSSSGSSSATSNDSTDPVSDDSGGSSGSGKRGAGNTSTSVAHAEAETGSHNEADEETEHANTVEVEHNKQTVKSDAKKLLIAKRQAGKEHTQAERKKSCLQRQVSINNRSVKYGKDAQRHLDKYNDILTKVKAFQTSKQLPTADFDALDALALTAVNKQAAAHAAVDTLEALDIKIDCTASDPASSVADLKAAVSNAHTALKEYRQSIRDLVIALKAANPDTTTTKTEDN